METDIVRINFFNGLFLKDGEFLDEQLYHQHMRRRIHYVLFTDSGVVPVRAGDLEVTPDGGKTFHVTAGMAVSVDDSTREGKEIVLREDSSTIDLVAEGFVATEEAFVTIHYEDVLKNPQTIEPTDNTRIEEQAVISLHKSWPVGAAPNGEEYILLGKVDFDTMDLDVSQRNETVLNSLLVGSAPSPTAPTISGISVNGGAPGDVFTNVQITGTNLDGATAVNFIGGPVTATIVDNTSATTLVVDVTIGAVPSTTSLTFDVVKPTGTATSSGSGAQVFLVTVPSVPVPAIAFFNPAASAGQQNGQTVDIHGTNLHSEVAPFPKPVSSMTIELTAIGQTVPVDTTTIQALSDSGANQRLEFEMPTRHATWSSTQSVTLTLQVGTVSVSVPYRYNDPF